MSCKFVTFHTMIIGPAKPLDIVGCAMALVGKGAKVLIMDGVMYEQSAIPHQFHMLLNSLPGRPTNGRNLYDLIADYNTLCSNKKSPPGGITKSLEDKLVFPVTKRYRDHVFPDVIGRISTIPDYSDINYLAGNNGSVVEVKDRLDFFELFESRCGFEFFKYIRKELSEVYDFVLLSAPPGHQEISGIFCSHMTDLILAIDIDSPAFEKDASFQACRKLAQRIREEGLRPISVKSVKEHNVKEIVDMIMEE